MIKKESLKIGVIGCGLRAFEFKTLINNIDTINIVAAVDPLIKRAYNIAGKEHSYSKTENLYNNEDIDAVYISTPPYLNKPLIKEAFENRKHIFCEKPVSISIKDARYLYDLDKKFPKIKLGFNYQYRYDYNCYNLMHGIKNGYIGNIYYANCNIIFHRSLAYFKQGPWRSKLETAGGGTLLIHGSHILDIMIWVLGEPVSVIGKIDNLKFKNIEVEDIGFGIIEFENDCYALINDSMIVKPPKKRIKDLVELNIFGKNGSCFYEFLDAIAMPSSSLKWYGVKDYKIKDNLSSTSPFSESTKAFTNWILYDKPFLNTVEESSKVLLLIKTLYKSSKSGKKEKVEKL